VITELEFKSLASQGYNRIPLISEAFADLETPLSLYLKLAGGQKHSFLLESVVGGERFGRYSFIGLPARTLLRASGDGDDALTEVVSDGQVLEAQRGNPLDFIARYQQRFRVALRPGLPRFCGGLAGYFGYEAARFIEPRLAGRSLPGGIGTLSQALGSGRPMLITPVAFDQPDNAHRASRLGVARVVPFRKVTATNLTAQIRAIFYDRDCRDQAAKVGSEIRSEAGVQRACDLIEKTSPDF